MCAREERPSTQAGGIQWSWGRGRPCRERKPLEGFKQGSDRSVWNFSKRTDHGRGVDWAAREKRAPRAWGVVGGRSRGVEETPGFLA